jgi:NMD protein affecting ribosome stability and mRNA decay
MRSRNKNNILPPSHYYKRFSKEFCTQKMKEKKKHDRTGNIKPQEKKRQGIGQ